jgi:leader peptidase (prepilin peptidase)/N-methyltransferase
MGELPVLSPAVLAGFAFAVGLVVGSFLNVVVHRLPLGESVVWPGSRCPTCRMPIRAFDNVPVVSFLLLRGRCRSCGARISWRYPLFELLCGGLFAAVSLRYGATLESCVWMAFSAVLLATAAIDFDHHVIPDELSLGGLAAGLVLMPALALASGASPVAAFGRAALGAALGGGSFWALGFAHARLSVAMGRRFAHWPGAGEALPRPSQLDYWVWFPGLGFGDVKLMAMIGAFLGVVGVVETILGAACAGLLLGLGWAAVTRRLDAPFGFAPAIAAGAIAAMLWPGWTRLAVEALTLS